MLPFDFLCPWLISIDAIVGCAISILCVEKTRLFELNGPLNPFHLAGLSTR
jgi:hypothetical protein